MATDDSLRVLMLGAALDAQGGVSSVERLLVDHAPPEIDVHHVATMVEGSRWKKGLAFLQASSSLTRAVATRNVRLVHLHMAVRTSVIRKILFGRLTSLAKMPTVVHAHGGDFDNWFRRLSPQYQRRIRRLLAHATQIVVLSESWKRFYVSECGAPESRVQVLPNPVVLPPTTPDRRHEGPVRFLFLGAMDDRKGAFRAVNAYSELEPDARVGSHLLLAGNGRVAELRALVASRGLSEHVTVREWADPKERDRLLRESDVFVLPSSNEGLPMGMLEAMSWGLPVVTTPVGGIPEVVKHRYNGLLVDPFNTAELAGAYRQMITDRESRLRMGVMARDSVKPLDIANYWKSLTHVYQTAIARNGSTGLAEA